MPSRDCHNLRLTGMRWLHISQVHSLLHLQNGSIRRRGRAFEHKQCFHTRSTYFSTTTSNFLLTIPPPAIQGGSRFRYQLSFPRKWTSRTSTEASSPNCTWQRRRCYSRARGWIRAWAGSSKSFRRTCSREYGCGCKGDWRACGFISRQCNCYCFGRNSFPSSRKEWGGFGSIIATPRKSRSVRTFYYAGCLKHCSNASPVLLWLYRYIFNKIERISRSRRYKLRDAGLKIPCLLTSPRVGWDLE